MGNLEKPRIVVLSGSGISAESGLKTFRDSGGLWEGYSIYDVATPEAWESNPETVLDFYNIRRDQVRNAEPNAAHYALVQLEKTFDVRIVTQNVDDLHERAGSRHVLHLHGEIMKARSSADSSLIYPLGERNIEIGDTCEKGSQLRPHVVWFGEMVPAMVEAAEQFAYATALIVIGTSLAVYPAAGLVDAAPQEARKYVVNPDIPEAMKRDDVTGIPKTACEGVPPLVKELLGKSE